MQEWGFTYKNILEHALYFLAEREERNAAPNPRPWSHFFSFATQAAEREWPDYNMTIFSTGTKPLEQP